MAKKWKPVKAPGYVKTKNMEGPVRACTNYDRQKWVDDSKDWGDPKWAWSPKPQDLGEGNYPDLDREFKGIVA
jgi:hypothetical protein